MTTPNGRNKSRHPAAAVRLLDFSGAQAAASWVDVTSTGAPSVADAPTLGLDSANALQISQGSAAAAYIARYRYYNAAGWDCRGSDLWSLAMRYPTDTYLPSRFRVGSSGTLEVTLSSDGDGVFTNNLLITLGGGGTFCGLPEMYRNVWTWNTSDMTPGGAINLASVKNVRLKLNTAAATDSMVIQGLWNGRRASPFVCVVFDDGWASQGLGASEAANIANARGIKLTHYVIPALIDGSDGSTYLSEAELVSIYAAGNAVAVHGTGPAGAGSLVDYADAGLAHVLSQQSWVQARGYDWRHYAYPGGAYNADVLNVMGRLEMLTARSLAGISYTAGPPETYPSRGSYYLQSVSVAGPPRWLTLNAAPLSSTLTLTQVKTYIDLAIKKGEGIILYGHKLGGAADSLTFTTTDFTALCDFILLRRQQGLIDALTVPQAYDSVQGRALIAASRTARA